MLKSTLNIHQLKMNELECFFYLILEVYYFISKDSNCDKIGINSLIKLSENLCMC